MLIFSTILLLLSDLYLMPIFRRAAALRARSIATNLINSAVSERMRDEPIRYSDIIAFEKDENGHICAFSADMVAINELKSTLSLDIYRSLQNARSETYQMPLGSLSHSTLLIGKGPSIPFTFMPIGAVTTDFRSSFSSAGINQTCHRILLEIKTDISVLTPLKSVSEEVVTTICVAETVIVGDVPEAFTNVQNIGNADDEISGDVVDFGAHNFGD